MKVSIYPKPELAATWSADRKRLEDTTQPIPTCLRCGGPIDRCIATNALSRALDVYVCASCGTEEALEDYLGQYRQLINWDAVRCERIIHSKENADLILRPDCPFRNVFRGPFKSKPYSGFEIPEQELAYSRSYFSNGRWYTTWFHCEPVHSDPEVVREVDAVMDALLEMPEFINLRAFRRMSMLCAERTSEPTEFNLYGETKHFNLWLRLITRERDYNLYAHYFLKRQQL